MTTPAAGRGRGLKGSGVRNNGVGSWIARRARRTPDRVAVLHGDDRLTYAQLHDRVTRLAHGLRGLGVRRGDRVAYLGPNHPAFLETLFAAGTLGAILVPLNARLAVPELAPAEVENVLREHPAVADCGVIGVPDTRWGEVGRAVVVLRPGAQASEADLLGFLDGRIARFKVPKSVQFTGELPRTGTGKILKKRLRETHGDG